MTANITLSIKDYHRAKAYAEEQNLSLDELFVSLIGQLTLKDEDKDWNALETDMSLYTMEELEGRINLGEQQFANGECKTHEQLMAELQQQYPWLR